MVHLARLFSVGVEIGVRLHLPSESHVLEVQAAIVRSGDGVTAPGGFAVAVEFKDLTAEDHTAIEAVARATEASCTEST
jgi:hypothetical protein